MRTDGVNLSPEAVEALRDVIGTVFGPAQLPAAPWQYKSRAKNAQEAHEAIRPTNPALLPDQAAAMLTPDQVWEAHLACQRCSRALHGMRRLLAVLSVRLAKTAAELAFRSSCCGCRLCCCFVDRKARLYGLIWRRAVASQMNAAELEQVTAAIGWLALGG